MRRWLIAFRLFWAGLLCLPLAAGAEEGAPLALPALTSRVVDLTATLTPPQKVQLETDLKQLEADKGAQLAILLLPSVKPESIEQFGIRLAEAWKLGRKGVDDGLIIIVAKNDRRMRIEVGYGLEGAVPDAVAKRIVSERMAPRFKQGDYFAGLQDAVQALATAIGSETGGQGAGGQGTGGGENAAPSLAANDGGEPWWMDSNLLTFGLIAGAGILHALFGIMGYVAAAGVVGVIVYFATASWLLGLGAAVAVFLLALLGGGRAGGLGSPGGFISSSGGSSWGSSSDSGFSGGGGSFGGGGASGDW